MSSLSIPNTPTSSTLERGDKQIGPVNEGPSSQQTRQNERTRSNTAATGRRALGDSANSGNCQRITNDIFSGRRAEQFHDASTEAQKKIYDVVCNFFDAGFKKTSSIFTSIVDGPQLTANFGGRSIKLETEVFRKIGQTLGKIGFIFNGLASICGRGVLTGLASIILNLVAIALAFTLRAAVFVLEKGLGVGAGVLALGVALVAAVAALLGFIVAGVATILGLPIVLGYNEYHQNNPIRHPIVAYLHSLLGKPNDAASPLVTGLTNGSKKLASLVVSEPAVTPASSAPTTSNSSPTVNNANGSNGSPSSQPGSSEQVQRHGDEHSSASSPTMDMDPTIRNRRKKRPMSSAEHTATNASFGLNFSMNDPSFVFGNHDMQNTLNNNNHSSNAPSSSTSRRDNKQQSKTQRPQPIVTPLDHGDLDLLDSFLDRNPLSDTGRSEPLSPVSRSLFDSNGL